MINYGPLADQTVGNSPMPSSVSQDPIAFEGFGLQNDRIRTTLSDHDDLGRVDIATFDFPRDDGGGMLSMYRRGRQIRLNVTIASDTPESLNAKIDEIKKQLGKTEGNLNITVNGEIRRIRATVTAVKFERKHYNLTFVTGEVSFATVEPFFRAVSDQSWLFEGR